MLMRRSSLLTVLGKRRPRAPIAPTLTLATIETDGRLRVVHDRNVTGNAGYSLTASGGNPTLSSPEAGDSARVIFYTLSRVPDATETVTIAYDSGTGDIVSASGAVELEDIASQIVYVMIEVADSEPIPNPAQNTTFVSDEAGNYEDTTTWAGGVVPGEDDDIQILHTVTVTGTTAACRGCLVASGGKLAADGTVNTRLTATTILAIGTGEIELGTESVPVAADKLCELVIRDTALPSQALDPLQLSNGLIMTDTSKIRAWGATKTCKWSEIRLSVEPEAGHTTLTFETNPLVGWRAGDKLVLPPTDPLHSVAIATVFGYEAEDEVLEIQSVTDNVVTLTAPLARDHLGARDSDGNLRFLPHCMNLTRNVVIRSESAAATVRGHTMFGERVDVGGVEGDGPGLGYVLFKWLGRTTDAALDDTTVTADRLVSHYGTNQRGRYPAHLHHHWGPVNATDAGWQSDTIGVAVDDGLKWGIALHEACYSRWIGANVYDVQYSGFQFENGNEAYNRLEECGVMKFIGSDPVQSAVCNAYTIMELGENEFIGNGGAYGHTSAYLSHTFHVDGLRRSQPDFSEVSKRYPLFRGADLHMGTETVDYELKARGTTGWTHTGFESYAVDKAGSFDHYSFPDGLVFTDLHSWAHHEEPWFEYGGFGNHTFVNPVCRKFHTSGFSQQSWGHGSTSEADRGTTNITGADIYSEISGATSVYNWRGVELNRLLYVEDSTLEATTPVEVEFASSGGVTASIADMSMTTILNGCTLTPSSGAVEVVLSGLEASGGNLLNTVVPMCVHQVLVLNRSGSNYQLFWAEQDPTAKAYCEAELPDFGIFTTYAATSCGGTNQDSFNADGKCVGGELMPAGASTVAWLSGGKAAEFLRATVAANGTTVTVAASTAITTDGTGWSLDLTTGGAVALTYVSGSGTKSLTFTAGSTVATGDTGDALYDADTGDAELTLSGAALPDLTFPVTNDSEQAGSSWTLIAEATGFAADGFTTAAIDTTGADLLVFVLGQYRLGSIDTPTDSKGNTLTGLTAQESGDARVRIWYVANPTVGTGHTFSMPGNLSFASLHVFAYSGANAAPADQESGSAASAVTSIQAGSITPSVDNCLIIAALCAGNGETSVSIGSGYTIQASNASSGGNWLGAYAADLVQATAAATNPQWSWTGSVHAAAAIASFKPA